MRSLFRESMETSTAGGRWGRPSAWGRCTAPGTRAAAITTRSHTPSPFPCFCCPSPLAPFVPAHSSLLSRVILSPLVHFVTSDTLPTFFFRRHALPSRPSRVHACLWRDAVRHDCAHDAAILLFGGVEPRAHILLPRGAHCDRHAARTTRAQHA